MQLWSLRVHASPLFFYVLIIKSYNIHFKLINKMKKFIPIIVLALSMSSCLPNFYQSIKSVSYQDASQNGAIFFV